MLNEQPPVNPGSYDTADTAVTPAQMAVLDFCIDHTDQMLSPVVEVGAFRGVTTSRFASRTERRVFAVDPFMGYGGAATDMHAMAERLRNLGNAAHLRLTSGEASRRPELSTVSFVFIDAVHDYVNCLYDGLTRGNKLELGGLIAFHDTDSPNFPGVQRAAWTLAHTNTSPRCELFAHVSGLVVLRRTG